MAEMLSMDLDDIHYFTDIRLKQWAASEKYAAKKGKR
jgi:hypothetical protein